MSTISLANIWQASVYNIPKKFDCKWYLEQRFNTKTKLRPTEKSLRQRTLLLLLNSKLDIYMFITVGWLSLVQWPTIQFNMILCLSALVMAQLWCKDMIFREMYLINIKLLPGLPIDFRHTKLLCSCHTTTTSTQALPSPSAEPKFVLSILKFLSMQVSHFRIPKEPD